MSQSFSGEVFEQAPPGRDVPFESAVDWISLTCRDEDRRDILRRQVAAMVQDEVDAGNEQSHWSASGYDGIQAGGAGYGDRHEDTFVRISGPPADRYWRQLYPLATNCSRLDVQVTVRTGDEPAKRIEAHYREAKKHSASRKRGPAVAIYRGNDGSGTLYLGKRSSEKMGRCYNKHIESGLDHYQNAVRYEVELKDDCALLMLNALAASKGVAEDINAFVAGFFRNRGCVLKWSGIAPLLLCRPRRRSDNERRLVWLASSVRPTIEKLCEDGMLVETLEALSLRTLVHIAAQCSDTTLPADRRQK